MVQNGECLANMFIKSLNTPGKKNLKAKGSPIMCLEGVEIAFLEENMRVERGGVTQIDVIQTFSLFFLTFHASFSKTTKKGD